MSQVNVRMPGGGVYGRSARPEVRNPILDLEETAAIMALPIEQRRAIAKLIRGIARHADEKAEHCWKKRKGVLAFYWRVVCTYAKHIARAIERRDNQ